MHHGVVDRVAVVMRPFVVAALVLMLLFGALWLGQRRLIYLPDRSAVPPAGEVIPGARDVAFETSDGLRLAAWFVPSARSVQDRRLAVLMAPGNGGNRLGRTPLARALSMQGLSVLLLDYRGYAGNPGRPTETGLARDIRAARDFLVSLEGWPPGRIIYFGESLGCAVVTELATEHPPAGLVLRSPFVDLAAVGRHHYPLLPVRLLLRDRFPLAQLVGSVTAPTVVIYATGDSIVPPEQSRAVAERAGGAVEVVVIGGADHNDPELFDGRRVIDAVVALADRIGPT